MQRIDVHYEFIQDAINRRVDEDYTLSQELDSLPEDLKMLLNPKEQNEESTHNDMNEEQEEQVTEEEALSRAPSSCEGEEDNYCDGNVYMSCVEGKFTAFSCSQVRWVCEEQEVETGCYP